MKRIIILIACILIGGSIFIWGYSTNWGKSFDDEAVGRYCYTACINKDTAKYCTPNLIVSIKAANSPNYGSKMKNISCENLAVNNVVQACAEISCPRPSY